MQEERLELIIIIQFQIQKLIFLKIIIIQFQIIQFQIIIQKLIIIIQFQIISQNQHPKLTFF